MIDGAAKFDDSRHPPPAALAAVLNPSSEWCFTGLAMGYAYAALILSFLGGMWWGLVAQARIRVPTWVWIAAISPSLSSLFSAVPWAIGDAWPGPSLALLGLAMFASLMVDLKSRAEGHCPPWWLRLRVPLSVGLGMMTLALGYLA